MATDFVTLSLIDHKGDRATIVYYFKSGALAADIDNYVTAVVDSLDGITGAQIDGVQLTTNIEPFGTAPKSAPDADVDMERGVNFGYAVDGSVYRHTIRVPAIDPALGDGEEIDPDQSPQSIYNGIVTTDQVTLLPSNRSGLELTAGGQITPAKITFHKAIK